MSLDCLNNSNPHLKAELANGILTLAIDRPEAKNALYTDLYIAIEQALYQADASNDVRIIVLRGANNDFSAGNDMQDFAIFAQPNRVRAVEAAVRAAAVDGAAHRTRQSITIDMTPVGSTPSAGGAKKTPAPKTASAPP